MLTGYWTHAGYLNWDTGLGFKRWHQGKKLGLSQAALLGIAVCPELAPHGTWAKHMLDRSFELFDRWVERDRGLPPANAFSVPSIDDNESSQVLAAARVQANAAQAAIFGLGRMRGEQPPPLYAYDPDVGRLAITTPTYNTAIVAVSRNAFPYGGMDIARLFDGQQEVAGGVGGRPPASFGVVVRSGGKLVAASQHAVEQADSDPLELLEAPRGTGVAPEPVPEAPVRGRVRDDPRARHRARGRDLDPDHAPLRRDLHRDRVAGERRGRQGDRGAVPELGRERARLRRQRARRAARRHARDVAERRGLVPRRERAQRLRRGRRRRQERDRPAPEQAVRARPSPARRSRSAPRARRSRRRSPRPRTAEEARAIADAADRVTGCRGSAHSVPQERRCRPPGRGYRAGTAVGRLGRGRRLDRGGEGVADGVGVAVATGVAVGVGCRRGRRRRVGAGRVDALGRRVRRRA